MTPGIYEIDQNWKKSITTSPDKPFCSLLNVWDAMFWWNPTYQVDVSLPPGGWMTRSRLTSEPDDYTMKGLQLPHTTLALDLGVYEKNNREGSGEARMSIRDDCKWDDFALMGIDVSIPKFDSRVLPLFLTVDNVTDYIRPTVNAPAARIRDELSSLIELLDPPYNVIGDHCYEAAGRKPGIKVYPKKAAMMPVNTQDAYLRSPFYMRTMGGSSPKNTFDDYQSPAAIATEEQGAILCRNANLILSQHDYNFERRFLADRTDRYEAWDSILLNVFEETTLYVPFFSLGGRSDTKADTDDMKKLVGEQSFTDLSAVNFSANPVAQFLLRNSWFFVKCAFYADYIDYRDFAQSLNKEAAVKHKNLIVSKEGDFDRFDHSFDRTSEGWKAQMASRNTRPYAPANTPTEDFLTEDLANTNNTLGDISSQGLTDPMIRALVKLGLDPDGVIGSVHVEPFELRQKNQSDEDARLTNKPGTEGDPGIPPMFFDPDSRKPIDAYEGTIPVAIPRDGNVVVDGRIFSPTIDEIWSAIKKLAGGRSPDPYGDPSSSTTTSAAVNVGDFGGYPVGTGEKIVEVDTHLYVKNFPFRDIDAKKYGDPLRIEYNLDSETDEGSFRVVSWINDPSDLRLNIIRELSGLMNSLTDHFGSIPNSDFMTQLIDPVKWASEFSTDYRGQYSHGSYVMSLREIEGLVKGLRYNFAYLISVLDRMNVWAGPVGQRNTDDVDGIGDRFNRAGGTAYMLHRGYSGLTGTDGSRNPHNTVFDGRETEGSKKWFGNLKDPSRWSQSHQVPTWAVYMGADGEWHSTAQALILPVIREKW